MSQKNVQIFTHVFTHQTKNILLSTNTTTTKASMVHLKIEEVAAQPSGCSRMKVELRKSANKRRKDALNKKCLDHTRFLI